MSKWNFKNGKVQESMSWNEEIGKKMNALNKYAPNKLLHESLTAIDKLQEKLQQSPPSTVPGQPQGLGDNPTNYMKYMEDLGLKIKDLKPEISEIDWLKKKTQQSPPSTVPGQPQDLGDNPTNYMKYMEDLGLKIKALKPENQLTPPLTVPRQPLFDTQAFVDNPTAYMKMKYKEVLQTISKLSLSIEEYEKSIAGSLVIAMSGEKHTTDDIILVKKHLALFLSLIASCYVVYNWFFVMYFTNEKGERVKTLELSLTKMKQNIPIFHFFFKYTLCVLSMMDKFVLDIVPSMVSSIVGDRRLQFISLFVIVYLIISVFGSVILKSVDSTTIISVYVCIFVLYELYCVLSDFLPDENGSIDVTRMQKYMIVGAYTPLIFLMLFFVRLVWSIVIIGITSLVNCAYILLMSFFAIPVYSSSSFFKTFKILNEYIWESKKSEGGLIELSINILYRFLYEISFILILLFGISDYSLNMSTMSQMPTIINCICYVFVFLFAFIAYQRYLMNGSLSAYIDPQKPSPTKGDVNVSVPPQVVTNDVLTQPEIIPSHNDKFNFSENKLVDTKSSLIDDSTNTIKNKTSSITDDATNMIKNKLVDTMMKTVKDSKYGKMIPSKLLSSLAK
jgi:hypothetical protein